MMLTRILLEGEQALFPDYHTQVAGASAVIAVRSDTEQFLQAEFLEG
jgi:hypothetical protein